LNKINIITPPDKIFSDCLNILLIHPSESIKNELQNILANYENSCNIYVYENKTYDPNEIDWLLTVFNVCNLCIIDLDNSSPQVRMLSSYLIAKPKTYWLTNGEDVVYTHISNNRIYDLDFMSQLGGYFET
jgi:hypothetical protein